MFLRYHPQDASRVATLLQGGAILGRKFQSHESHIPFLLQLKVAWVGAWDFVW